MPLLPPDDDKNKKSSLFPPEPGSLGPPADDESTEIDPISGAKVLAGSVAHAPLSIFSAAVDAFQGQSGVDVVSPDPFERAAGAARRIITEREERLKAEFGDKEAIPGFEIAKDFGGLGRNLGFSTVAAGAGLAAGVGTAAVTAGGVGAVPLAAGAAAAGAVAYRAASSDFMRDVLTKADAAVKKSRGSGLTEAEQEVLKEEYEILAAQFGGWEAIPEAAGSFVGGGLLLRPLTGLVGKEVGKKILGSGIGKLGATAGRLIGTAGEEVATETITELGQTQVSEKAGLTDDKVSFTSMDDWVEAAKNVAPGTLLLTATLGGGILAGNKILTSRRFTDNEKIKAIIEGAEEPQSANFIDNMPEQDKAKMLDQADKLMKKHPDNIELQNAVEKMQGIRKADQITEIEQGGNDIKALFNDEQNLTALDQFVRGQKITPAREAVEAIAKIKPVIPEKTPVTVKPAVKPEKSPIATPQKVKSPVTEPLTKPTPQKPVVADSTKVATQEVKKEPAKPAEATSKTGEQESFESFLAKRDTETSKRLGISVGQAKQEREEFNEFLNNKARKTIPPKGLEVSIKKGELPKFKILDDKEASKDFANIFNAPQKETASIFKKPDNSIQRAAVNFAKKFDRDIIFYTFAAGGNKGFVNGDVPGTIFLEAGNKGNMMSFILGHELLHTFEQSNPIEYNKFARVVEFTDKFKQLSKDRVSLKSETLANLAGSEFLKTEFWKEVAKESPTIAHFAMTKMISKIDDVLTSDISTQFRAFFVDLKKSRKELSNLLTTIAKQTNIEEPIKAAETVAARPQSEIGTRFKNTEDAVKFGVEAKPADVQNLKNLRDQSLAKTDELRAKAKAKPTTANLQAVMDEATAGQFYRESIEAAEGKHPNQPRTEPQVTKSVGSKVKEAVVDVADRVTFGTGESLKQFIMRKFVQRHVHLQETQDAIAEERWGQDLPEDHDVLDKITLYKGATGAALDEFKRNIEKPFVDELVREKISSDELADFAIAEHAAERNEQIARINPDFREKLLPGIGMFKSEADKLAAIKKNQDDTNMLALIAEIPVADEIIAKAKKSGRFKKLTNMSQRMRDVNNAIVNLKFEEGLMSKQDRDNVLGAYDFYTPARGNPHEDSTTQIGKGFDVRSKDVKTKRALGRLSRSENPILHTFAEAEKTILNINKTRVDRALLKLVEANPNKDFWSVDTWDGKRVYNPATDEVEYNKIAPWVESPSKIGVIDESGKQRIINFNPKNPKAMFIVRALKNMGVDSAGIATRFAGVVNRYFAQLHTTFNPEFMLGNFTRDIQTAGIAVSVEQSGKMAAKIVNPKAVGRGIKAMINIERGKKPKNETEKFAQEFVRVGSKTGFIDMQRDIKSRERELKRLVKDLEGKNTLSVRRGLRSLSDIVKDINTGVENGVRLNAYIQMRKSGFSPQKSGVVAKRLTIDFNQQGELSSALNAWFIFFNASTQGVARVIQLMSSKRGLKIGAGIVSTAFSITMMNIIGGGEDPKDGKNFYLKKEDFTRQRKMLFYIPGTDGTFFTIPLPYGFNIFWVLGEQMATALYTKDPLKGMLNVFQATLDSFNPLGQGNLVNLIAPTIIDPVVELYLNKNFAGFPIKPVANPYGRPTPQSQLYWKSVSPISKAVARKLNEMPVFTKEGGNIVRPGAIDVSPEVLDHIVKSMFGGLGAFALRTLNAPALAKQALSGEDVELRKVPFLRTFVTEPSGFETATDYREKREEMRIVAAERKARIAPKNKKLTALIPQFKNTEKTLSNLFRRRSQIESSKLSNKIKENRVKRISDTIEKTQQRFIKAFNKRSK